MSKISVHIKYVHTYLGVIDRTADGHVPWQKVVALADGVVGNALEAVV